VGLDAGSLNVAGVFMGSNIIYCRNGKSKIRKIKFPFAATGNIIWRAWETANNAQLRSIRLSILIYEDRRDR
jgi:hypothetical protein